MPEWSETDAISFYFQIFYSSSADHNELKPIAIPNCDAPCLLTQFRSSIDSIYVTDYEKECQSIE